MDMNESKTASDLKGESGGETERFGGQPQGERREDYEI